MKKEYIEKLIDGAIIKFDGGCGFNYSNGLVLKGIEKLYKTTQKEEYKKFVLNYLDNCVQENGTIDEYDAKNMEAEVISAGLVLFFAYEETGNEKFRKAIETLNEQIKNQPRSKYGNFMKNSTDSDELSVETLYYANVFYMAYETKFGGKEHYNDVISQFKAVTENVTFDAVTKKSVLALYLMATIDTLDAIDQSVYEYYDDLKQMYKKALKVALLNDEYDSEEAKAMVAYTMLKACKLKVILEEKYYDKAIAIFDSIDVDAIGNVGPFMMAYAQMR